MKRRRQTRTIGGGEGEERRTNWEGGGEENKQTLFSKGKELGTQALHSCLSDFIYELFLGSLNSNNNTFCTKKHTGHSEKVITI